MFGFEHPLRCVGFCVGFVVWDLLVETSRRR